jgi:hypothetical protein
MRLAVPAGLAILMLRALGCPTKLPERSHRDGGSELA